MPAAQRGIADRVLGGADKGLPSDAAGLTVAEFLTREPRLADLWTPLVVLDDSVLDDNIAFLAGWVAARGLELMPHGKTTMAPQLWHRQLDAGATGITVANPSQLRVAVDAGIPAIMLANQLVQPGAIRWTADVVARGTRVWSWVDDVAGIEAIERALGPVERPLEVLVDVGRPGGRTGARSLTAAVAVAERAAASPAVRLAGITGYEGSVAHGRGAEALASAGAYIDELLAVHDAVGPLYDDGDVLVSAGGSAYPDVVGTAFAAASVGGDGARFVLRSGAYIVHDHGYYRQNSPFEGSGLRPAARGVARVVSRLDADTAIVDAGKRDFPYDEGLPTPLYAITSDGERMPLPGAETTKLSDQHGFVRIGADSPLAMGDLVVFGLSHPCTMLDKWRLVPVVDSVEDLEAAIVTDLVETRF
ncbi:MULTISPECIES: alanine racemase [Microbacterium]|uniref:D-threonine aldolase n=1 Tax=Microbacterium trichothecenolyticum TaxID=69370 RepID=A0A0M2HFC6_MICTR|nr:MULTISPECIES: alanine racemase [Microbacterium]KJL43436.1 D-threonine aldolase [Microbacterium trichothecenolyticum]MDR7189636.1 D-serine deaminase-like pyridoxal phosphate-dependent protein [Microbacterium sp. BE35]